MSIGYWERVQKAGFEVPSDRPLDDLTAELTTMLGSTRPEVRDGTAFPAFATWIERGVYDDLLAGLGDGMAAGLSVGLGESVWSERCPGCGHQPWLIIRVRSAALRR